MSTFDLTNALDRLKLCVELSKRCGALVVCAYNTWSNYATMHVESPTDWSLLAGFAEYVESRVLQKGVTRVYFGVNANLDISTTPLHMLNLAWPEHTHFTLTNNLNLRLYRTASPDTIRVWENPNGDLCKKPTSELYRIKDADAEAAVGGALISIIRLFDELASYNVTATQSRAILVNTGYPLGSPERLDIWRNDDNVRRRLAAHLLEQEGVLVDMATMPNRPWKGMKFFHGTGYRTLQEGGSKRCNLTWEDGHSAFTSPYYHKTFRYGRLTFTYRIQVDGRALRMIDMRSDRLRIKQDPLGSDDMYSGYNTIRDLSGISYNGSDRTPAATQLRHLFRDEDVDGIILNNDVEWVWMHPERVLKWDPDCVLYKVSTAEVESREDKRIAGLHAVLQTSPIEALAPLLESATVRSGSYPGLVVQRSAWDRSVSNSSTSQFTGSSSSDVMWKPYKATVQRVYELPYATLMSTLWGGLFMDMYMGNTVTETHLDTFYNMLEHALKRLDATIVVVLPSGVEQVLPRLELNTPYVPPPTHSPRVRPSFRGFVGEERASNRQRLENTMGRLRL